MLEMWSKQIMLSEMFLADLKESMGHSHVDQHDTFKKKEQLKILRSKWVKHVTLNT